MKGIRALAEEIEVRLPFEMKHDDEEIARRAANILAWDVYLPANSAHVKVQKGWVTLSGDVDWQYQKQSAESAVRRLAGVIGVINLINIRPHVSAGEKSAKGQTGKYSKRADIFRSSADSRLPRRPFG